MSRGEKKPMGIKKISPKMPKKKNKGIVKNYQNGRVITKIPYDISNGPNRSCHPLSLKKSCSYIITHPIKNRRIAIIATPQSKTAHGIAKNNTFQV